MSNSNPTADYRKYPKGPNFTLIVALASVFLILALIAGVVFLHYDARKVDPHRPNPEPNSLYLPALPSPTPPAAVA